MQTAAPAVEPVAFENCKDDDLSYLRFGTQAVGNKGWYLARRFDIAIVREAI